MMPRSQWSPGTADLEFSPEELATLGAATARRQAPEVDLSTTVRSPRFSPTDLLVESAFDELAPPTTRPVTTAPQPPPAVAPPSRVTASPAPIPHEDDLEPIEDDLAPTPTVITAPPQMPIAAPATSPPPPLAPTSAPIPTPAPPPSAPTASSQPQQPRLSTAPLAPLTPAGSTATPPITPAAEVDVGVLSSSKPPDHAGPRVATSNSVSGRVSSAGASVTVGPPPSAHAHELLGEELIEEVDHEPPPAPAKAPPPTPAAAPPPIPAGEAGAKRKRRGKQWYEDVFDEDYLRTLPSMTPQQTEREASFIVDALQLQPAAALLDVGCGYGRHAMELAARGFHVTGLDLSLPLLIRAADATRRAGVNVNFVHADMREMTFDGEFDAVYCLFTTFGFFDDETNRSVAAAMAKALKPGGRILIDVVNRDYLVADLPARVWWQGDGCVVLEEVDFNFFTSRVQSHRSVVFEDGRQAEHDISLRAYSLHEIGKILHGAGFKVLEVSGGLGLRGRFYGGDCRQILIAAEKK